VSHDSRDLLLAAFGCCVGARLFYKGFRDLRLERAIADLPTSKVRSMAMGPVELIGTAAQLTPLEDPIYQQPCVYYRIDVEEERGSGKYSHWVNIYHADSNATPLLLVDDTGKVPVYPEGVEIYCHGIIDRKSSWLGNLFSDVDPSIAGFLSSIPGRTTDTLHVIAHIIREQEPLCVLGYAAQAQQSSTLERIAQRIDLSWGAVARRLKSDPAKLQALDVNKDGAIDSQEWDAGLKKEFNEELEGQRKSVHQSVMTFPVVVLKNPNGFFVISNESKRELVAAIESQAGLYIFGGPLLFMACVVYLYWRVMFMGF